MSRDPYFFPFEIVNKNELIPGDNYYMKLNDSIIRRFVDRRQNVPVSDLKGTFVRLHSEPSVVGPREYAVFKNVFIMNKSYKLGLCRFMLVRYPEGFLASAGGCDTYSDQFQNRIVNTEREVFLDVGHWRFGKPTEQKLLSERALQKINPKLPDALNNEVLQFQGKMKAIGGKKSRRYRKSRKSRGKRKTRRH